MCTKTKKTSRNKEVFNEIINYDEKVKIPKIF